MKNLSKLFVLAFFFLTTLPSFTQNQEEYLFLYTQAKNLEESGCLKEAGTEYKRYIFMQDYAQAPGKYIDDSLFALSRIYEKNNQLDLALNYYQQGLSLSLSKGSISTLQVANLQTQHINLLSQKAEKLKTDITTDYEFAKYLFLDDFSLAVKQKAYYAHLKNLVQTNQWEVLQFKFDDYCKEIPDLFSQEEISIFNQQLNKLNKFKPKNPMLAAHLSFIPGLGQLYAHDYKDALNAFLLNGTLISLCVYSCYSLNLWDFSLFELNPTIRFYRGNIVNAQIETYEYNSKKINEYKAPLLTIISDADKRIHFENCD